MKIVTVKGKCSRRLMTKEGEPGGKRAFLVLAKNLCQNWNISEKKKTLLVLAENLCQYWNISPLSEKKRKLLVLAENLKIEIYCISENKRALIICLLAEQILENLSRLALSVIRLTCRNWWVCLDCLYLECIGVYWFAFVFISGSKGVSSFAAIRLTCRNW